MGKYDMIELQTNKILKRVVNILFPSKKVRVQLRYELDKLLLPKVISNQKAQIENKYSNYWIFTPFWAWGDFIMGCAMVKQFKKEHGGKVLMLYANKKQKDFIKAFKDIDESMQVIPEFFYANGFTQPYSIHNEFGLCKGKIFEISHHVFKDAENNKSENFTQVYQKMLEIKKLNYAKPVVPDSTKAKILNIYNNMAQGKEVIMLTPHANSYNEKEISVDFWNNLASILEKNGYKIIFNTNSTNFNRFEQLNLPLFEQSYFATLCKSNISIRSGFTDVITIMEADNQIVLFPKSVKFITVQEKDHIKEMRRIFQFNENKSFQENMFCFTSINNMFNKNFLEFVVTDEKQAIEKITEHFKIDNKIKNF